MADQVVDRGLTHVALVVTQLDRSIEFYEHFAHMQVVHRRSDDMEVAWLSDLTRPFVLVLVQGPMPEAPLGPFAHLGIGCESREHVDRLVAEAAAQDCLALGPLDSGYPVGYWAFIRDPDGHTLELSYGQEVGLTVGRATHENR